MKSSETINELATALCKAQGELKGVPKDSDNPFFNSMYASLEGVISYCKPILHKNGLSVVQGPSGDGDVVIVHTRLMHTSGQWIETETAVKPVPAKIDRGSAEKAVTPQATGSAITYARRYGYMAIIGVAAADDDDGSAASKIEKGYTLPQEDLGTFEDAVKDVRKRDQSGTIIYTIETEDGHKLTTLSEELAKKAKGFKGTGERVIIESEPTKYGPRITAIAGKE